MSFVMDTATAQREAAKLKDLLDLGFINEEEFNRRLVELWPRSLRPPAAHLSRKVAIASISILYRSLSYTLFFLDSVEVS